jgi:hypothetical protein
MRGQTPAADISWRRDSAQMRLGGYNRLKNSSSIARRAVSRVTQAACMVIAIEPWILSS